MFGRRASIVGVPRPVSSAIQLAPDPGPDLAAFRRLRDSVGLAVLVVGVGVHVFGAGPLSVLLSYTLR